MSLLGFCVTMGLLMKFLFAKALIGLFFPIAMAASLSGDAQVNYSTATATPRIYPYIVEAVSPDGTNAGEWRGTSSQTTPFEIAANLGAKPYLEDKFSAFPSINMQMGSKITLYRAPSFTIFDGKRETDVRSWQKTVGDVLDEANILELGQDDKIDFAVDTKAESGMTIRITRVAVTQVKEKKAIDFQIIKKEDKTLDQGKTRIDQAGQKGELTLTYEVRREDGVQVSKTLLKTETTKQAINQLLIIGTKPVITGWCKYNDLVLDASINNNIDPNKICALMKKESNGHPDSVNNDTYFGLFQYESGFWADASKKAGFSGASITDPKAQIYVTAWAFAHGYSGRW